jgi:hypothetical protein
MNALAIVRAEIGPEIARACIRFGQYQAHAGYKQISAAAEVLQLINLKQSNGFKYIPIPANETDEAGQPKFRTAENFQEFCSLVLGRSYSAVMEEMEQVNVLRDAYDGLKRAGLTRRHMRAVMKAPEEKRLEIISGEAVDMTDPDAVREFVEELAADLEKEKLASQKAKEEHAAEQAAKDKLLAKKSEENHALQVKIELLPNVRPYSDRAKAIINAVQPFVTEATSLIVAINELLAQALEDHKGEAPPTLEEQAAIATAFTRAADDIQQMVHVLRDSTNSLGG